MSIENTPVDKAPTSWLIWQMILYLVESQSAPSEEELIMITRELDLRMPDREGRTMMYVIPGLRADNGTGDKN